ncbi:MAG TPA: hypothetical protein ENJ45_03410 [Phaeodactylibacter sp.]|nr:hypothetical protein [Phaeodactylibacter sp.]
MKNKIRHIYDLNQLLKNEKIHAFFESNKFEELLLKIANEDVLSFKNNNEWLKHPPSKAMIFKNTDAVWAKLKSTYFSSFKELVYGDLSNEQDILKTISFIQEKIKLLTGK